MLTNLKKIKRKLSSEFDENIIERVIDFLKSYNLVNDSVLAQKIVNTNVNLNKCGKNRIKQNLYNKGINRSTINEAVSELDKDTEFENAMYLAKKGMKE